MKQLEPTFSVEEVYTPLVTAGFLSKITRPDHSQCQLIKREYQCFDMIQDWLIFSPIRKSGWVSVNFTSRGYSPSATHLTDFPPHHHANCHSVSKHISVHSCVWKIPIGLRILWNRDNCSSGAWTFHFRPKSQTTEWPRWQLSSWIHWK